MSPEIFLLHSNCRIVKGYSRSLICDLQLRKPYPVPHSLSALFTAHNELHYQEIEQQLDAEDVLVFRDYLRFLVDHELGFFCSDSERSMFPNMSLDWDYPAHISNGIIDAGNEISFFNKAFTRQLDALGCYQLQFRFYGSPDIGHVRDLLAIIQDSEIQSVEWLVKSTGDENYVSQFISLSDSYIKIRSVLLHSHTADNIYKDFFDQHGLVATSKKAILSEKCCGIVDQNFFQSNIPHYTESLSHNTCLNRKISIDLQGNIKNCPSMKERFGNIKEVTLEEAVCTPEFKKYWGITKEEIVTCKDCEFRHICTDCRAYLENPEDPYSRPLKCGYDPYTCTWEEWSTHPLKQEAMAHYGINKTVG